MKFEFVETGEEIEVNPLLQSENSVIDAHHQIRNIDFNSYYYLELESKTPDAETWIVKTIKNWHFLT